MTQNINLTGLYSYVLVSGRVTLGSGPGVDIPVQGTGVLPVHCHIENSEGVVTIYPLSDNLSVDGVRVTSPLRLSQGVMLTIGRSNYMRFNHPAEAKLMKSVLPNPRISMAPINFEPDNSFHTKFNKKPPVAPRRSPRDSLSDSEEPPSSIMTKVSKFEYLAAQNNKKSISPKVFPSNVVTVNMPVKDVLGKSPPDLQSFSKNLPQSALNYAELNYNEKKLKLRANRSSPRNLTTRANTDPTNFFRSITPSPVSNIVKMEHRKSGSLGELSTENYTDGCDDPAHRKYEAELRRNQTLNLEAI
ncbi:hypothetical protein NQ317_018308 [Molorchus minor]|uniref:FHA domain-containing protein n=1 Tax=Molorchus minor TaxID=1323400 RepID=A0ABQ9IW64_9CUCU|nr:hypothetical protein NQ317_018308 [Molorchus minor]